MMTGQHKARIAWSAFAVALVLAAPASSFAQQDTGRYQLQRTGDGFIRIDTTTGSVSHCHRVSGVWTCASFDTDGDQMRREMDALKAQNKALKQRLAALEDIVADRSEGTANGFELPDEQQFEDMMGFLERAIRRLKKFTRTLQDVPGQDI